MDHAAIYHNGNGYIPLQKTTAPIAPAIEQVLPMDAKTQRRKRDRQRQTQVGTNFQVADGFLRTVFLPKLKPPQSLPDCGDAEKVEQDFYASLAQLATHYGIEPMQARDYGYPYNIALSLWEVQRLLRQKVRHWDNLRLVRQDNKTCLISEERYDTGASLYYIPIIPLFHMLKDCRFRRSSHLLLSVCSYLYHIAKVPYYRQEDSYLYWQYDIHKNWVEEEPEDEATRTYKRELHQAEWIGKRMEQKMRNRRNLTRLKARLDSYKPADGFDYDCWKLATDIFSLYSDYPGHSIFRNIQLIKRPEADESDYEEYYQDTIRMGMYISFVASTQGWLYEMLSECINNEFNECGLIEEPTIITHFDGGALPLNDFDFEMRLFALMEELCYLLNSYKKTTL